MSDKSTLTMSDKSTLTQLLDVSMLDSIVTSVITKFTSRATVGMQKYGTNLDRTDLTTADWIQHAQEELMDGILYLEKLKQSMSIDKATA